MYNLEETGKRIKRIREEKDLTEQELQEQIYVGGETIRKEEQGKRGMSIELLMEISSTLCVSSDYLLGIDRRSIDELKTISYLQKQVNDLFEKQLNS